MEVSTKPTIGYKKSTLPIIRSGAHSPDSLDYISSNLQNNRNGRISSLTTHGKHEKLQTSNERLSSQLDQGEEKQVPPPLSDEYSFKPNVVQS